MSSDDIFNSTIFSSFQILMKQYGQTMIDLNTHSQDTLQTYWLPCRLPFFPIPKKNFPNTLQNRNLGFRGFLNNIFPPYGGK